MPTCPIEVDLQTTLRRIAQLTAFTKAPGHDALSEVSVLLAEFVTRNKPAFSFEHFPLPAADGDVMSSYEINSEPYGPALLVNAMRGGVNSMVHDHGTWAVIIGVAGVERHCIYRETSNQNTSATAMPLATTTLKRVREARVQEGQPLILEQGLFHSLHTATHQPALTLHLYGQSLDTVSGRKIFDRDTGQVAYLSGPDHC